MLFERILLWENVSALCGFVFVATARACNRRLRDLRRQFAGFDLGPHSNNFGAALTDKPSAGLFLFQPAALGIWP
jgi:hypothetical protein